MMDQLVHKWLFHINTIGFDNDSPRAISDQ
jgi:hypothetical protein